MPLTSNNIQISLALQASDVLRSAGYDVLWTASETTDPETAGLAEPKGTIRLVPSFPANPKEIVRLKDGESPGPAEIPLPCLSAQVPAEPTAESLYGIGHDERWWQAEFRLDGFLLDGFQQREIASLLRLAWRKGDLLSVFDYESGSDPAPLLAEDVEVRWVEVTRPELIHEVKTIRYYVQLRMGLRFVE